MKIRGRCGVSKFQMTRLQNYQMKRFWLSAGKGLRGSDLGVVWRGDESLVALETWPRDNEITNTDLTGESR
jgi:hypothetical protein